MWGVDKLVWVNLFAHIMVTSHIRLKVYDHCILKSLIDRKGKTSQVHFTPRGEGPRAQKHYHGRKVCVNCFNDILYVKFHGPLKFASSTPSRGKSDANSGSPSYRNSHNHMVMALASCV